MINGKGVLVYSESRELELQLLGKGREFADRLGSDLSALLVGSGGKDPEELARYGADIVYIADDPKLSSSSVEAYCVVVLEAVRRSSPNIILMGATKPGKELAPRVAAALKTGCMTECISLDIDGEGRLLAERLTYGGSSVAKEMSTRKPHMATVPLRVFQRPAVSDRRSEVIKLDMSIPESRTVVVERREKARGGLGLEDAPIIVSAGRGFKKREDLKLLEELSTVLGAKIGCTRPVAADSGWLVEWIGISGRKVKPHLYLACGISGTVQHAAGIRDAQIIVSINEDENATIFELSDYGVVGDLYKVLPALTKAFMEKMRH